MDQFLNDKFNLLNLDVILWQILFIYLVIIFFFLRGVYSFIFGIFVFYFNLGFLSFFSNLDLFGALFWLSELTVIFVILILSIFFNAGSRKEVKNLNLKVFFISLIWFFLVLFSPLTLYSELNNESSEFLNFGILWINYYESLSNTNLNDFLTLFLLMFRYCSFEFAFFGFLLLVGSLFAISFFSFSKLVERRSLKSIFNFFDYYKFNTQQLFMRKQNLKKQESRIPSYSVFKRSV